MDGDGVDDSLDVCNNTPADTAVDAEGRPFGDTDQDCDTDLEDYALFQEGFTGPLPPQGMVFIPGGGLDMGCHVEPCEEDELPVHAVYVSPFYMDVYEVTNQQYCDYLNSAYGQDLIEVTGGVVYKAGDSEPYCDTTASSSYSRITWNDSTFGITTGKENHPMVMVSWYGAVAYANWRSAGHGRTPCYDLETWECNFAADGYRLPTEAEWEYAARGGEHSPYYKYPWDDDDIDGSKANYEGSGDEFENEPLPETTPVGYYDGGQTPSGSDMANGYGLYDMGGNAQEWCNDWHGSYDLCDPPPCVNPQGPASGDYRVIRGGSWRTSATYLRCASRVWDLPDERDNDFVLRLVFSSQ
jgi:formylglycine-generating enzyme required for sulfatase activity